MKTTVASDSSNGPFGGTITPGRPHMHPMGYGAKRLTGLLIWVSPTTFQFSVLT